MDYIFLESENRSKLNFSSTRVLINVIIKEPGCSFRLWYQSAHNSGATGLLNRQLSIKLWDRGNNCPGWRNINLVLTASNAELLWDLTELIILITEPEHIILHIHMGSLQPNENIALYYTLVNSLILLSLITKLIYFLLMVFMHLLLK